MNNTRLKIHFLGAAGTVTGSKFLIDNGNKKILVDCGLFQGLKKLRELNRESLPVDVAEIDTVLLTHGHLDHCGYLPKLVKSGFSGKIIGTKPTLEVAEIILFDSAKIQEEDASDANLKGYSKHHPAEPLYTVKDVEKTLGHFSPVTDGEWIGVCDGFRACFRRNGHIIGSTFIELEVNGKKLIFSGDIGRDEDPLLSAPQKPVTADYIFIESTYGDRLHPSESPMEQLKKIINETIQAGGTLIIPSFAVERTQTLMYYLWKLAEEESIPKVPMIMDSPMSSHVLNLFHIYHQWHNLSVKDCSAMCRAFFMVKDLSETYEVINDTSPKIVIAGSGMIGGGRVLHYLEHYISMPQTRVLLAGFQAEGTRGRALQEGAAEIKFFGDWHPVKAKIEMIQGISAHADQKELIGWLSEIKTKPQKVFIIHGEPHSADAFRVKLNDTYGWNSIVPELYSVYEI
jgi:metallo-beta-lactamase family protein